MDFHPKTSEDRIDAFRQIVKDGAYAKIDNCMIDPFSANYVVQVYDALSQKNRDNYASRMAPEMVQLAFSVGRKKCKSI